MASLLSTTSIINFIGLSTIVFTSYVVYHLTYNIFLHPLRKYPGPLLGRATRLYWCYSMVSGQQLKIMLALHQKYGDIVRIAPNELAFADPRAWKDIMGEDMERFLPMIRTLPEKRQPHSFVQVEHSEHAALRRMIAPGFSDRSMREQQPIIRKYVDALIKRLREKGAGGTAPVDLAEWFNFAMFDVISDLTFGESFGCMDTSDYHPYVAAIFESLKAGTVVQALGHWPTVKSLLFLVLPMKARNLVVDMLIEKTRRRIQLGSERPDLMQGLINGKDGRQFTPRQLASNAEVLIVAGSDTTATLLAGVTYMLLTHPHVHRKLVDEIRSSFKSEEEIDFETVSRLPYLLVCLEETMRIYPTAAFGLPRITPKEGASICGQYIPGNTLVSLHHYAIYHLEKNFALPEEFHPERWQDDPRFAGDLKSAFNPFAVGGKNCIGRNLAYIEMRLFLSQVLWNFDLTLEDPDLDWMRNQSNYTSWERGPLNVFLKPVVRT